MINKNELPQVWKWVKMEDVCNKIGDIDHKMPKQIPEGYPYVSTKDFTNDLKISFEKAKYISEEDFLRLSRKIKPERGDIIFPRYGTIGKNILIDFDKEFLVSYSCAILKPDLNLVLSKFLYLYSLSPKITDEIRKYVVETTQANIGVASIKNFVFPLPPLAEQERIVAKIEELFSELDAGLESLKTAQAQLKTYRQAVLKYAFEGKLTNDDVNEGELPNGWKWEKLGDVIEQPKYGTSKKCDYKFDGKGVLRIPNIASGFVDEADLKFASFDENEIKTYSLKESDLLTIRSNGSVDLVGKCALIAKKDEQFLYAGYLIRLRPRAEKLNSKFLLNVLSSSNLRNQIESKAKSTSGVNNINSEELKSLIVPLCTLEEQQRIVEEIESRLSVCDKLEETINASLKQAEALRQSILKQAFEGKLVPQNEGEDTNFPNQPDKQMTLFV